MALNKKKNGKRKSKIQNEDYGGHGGLKQKLEMQAKKKANEVTVRFIIKEAEYLMRCGRYQAAVQTVNRILSNLPSYGLEVNELFGEKMKTSTQLLLTTRAEAFLKSCKLNKALQDVCEVLEANPRHPQALAVRGDALFQRCEFEHALVNYERGLRISVEPLSSRFTIGKTRASESIL